MINRILVVGDDKKLLKSVEKAAAGHADIEVTADTAASGITGAISGATHVDEALTALAGAAREHETLFKLIAEAVDSREGHPQGSCARLCDHAVRLGQAMDLSVGELASLERGAYLHDIGKARVSNDVLMKKSVLSYDEWIELQAHTTKGADMLRAAGFEEAVLEIVQSHHECFDGDGYPNHLEGEAIPLLARIMKVCDVFTAMTSPRHYRTGVPTIDEALKHLGEERGKHFDPAIIDVFMEKEIGRAWAT